MEVGGGELVGFMDLGFSFKEEVSSHVMQIQPALQRLGVEKEEIDKLALYI